MVTNLIRLGQTRTPSAGDLGELSGFLAQLAGEPFRFARVSYGDELTLHFGDLRPARSAKLKKHMYGAYILGLRASSWILKAGPEPIIVRGGMIGRCDPSALCQRLDKEQLEAGAFVEPESRVLAATPFIDKPDAGIGLVLRFSDGSTLLVVPSLEEAVDEAGDPADPVLPELADWELSSPRGLLSVGPRMKWSFEPTTAPS